MGDSKRLDQVINIMPEKRPEDYEKEMEQVSVRIGQLYHQKLCVEHDLSQQSLCLNKLLIEYKTSLEKFPKTPAQ